MSAAIEFFESFFDKIFVINLDFRTDRRKHFLDQASTFGLTKFEWVRGVLGPEGSNCTFKTEHDPKMRNHHFGCTASHRKVLDLIDHFGYERTMVFEDDVLFRFPDTFEQFQAMLPEVPVNWDLLYLGGHYADKPMRRISPHVIQFGHMHTTSSYGITLRMARCMAPYISGTDPIDALYSGFAQHNNAFIFQPRIMIQYHSFSEIAQNNSNNGPCMEDARHENMV